MRMAVLAGARGALLVTGVVAGSQGAAPPPKPLVPAAADSIAGNPDAFYGQMVTIVSSVDRVLSPTTFVVDQDPKGSGKGEMLVLVSSLSAPLTPNQYVTVIGEVVRQENRPAIRATAVITAAGTDLAKVLPPPMTADEAAFDRTMKAIGPAFTSLRQAVGTAGSDGAAAQAAALVRGFEEAEAFWKKRGPAEAHKIAADARSQAAALEAAVKAGKWDDAQAAAGTLQQACSSCHAAHRERLDDGSYRIRMATGRGN
jgi:cytochrome c556